MELSCKMQLVLLAVLSLAVCGSGFVEVQSLVDYHRKVGIPLATKIKATEDAISANRNPAARIVGGNVAKPNSHPYLAGLIIDYVNHPGIGVCGSVLVSPERLVTAAHCWFDGKLQASRFVAVLGSHFLFSGGDRIPIWRVVTYPGWQPATSHNNLAVGRLPSRLILTPNIQPIALATNASQTFAGTWAVAVGYGVTSDSQTSVSIHTVVSEVPKQVITVEQCRSVFGAIVLNNTLCTNGTGGVGTCWGDGGGPLVATVDGIKTLIGIATFSAASGCENGHPSGYSRITSFLNFINTTPL